MISLQRMTGQRRSKESRTVPDSERHSPVPALPGRPAARIDRRADSTGPHNGTHINKLHTMSP
jgi:hypothetical protein